MFVSTRPNYHSIEASLSKPQRGRPNRYATDILVNVKISLQHILTRVRLNACCLFYLLLALLLKLGLIRGVIKACCRKWYWTTSAKKKHGKKYNFSNLVCFRCYTKCIGSGILKEKVEIFFVISDTCVQYYEHFHVLKYDIIWLHLYKNVLIG